MNLYREDVLMNEEGFVCGSVRGLYGKVSM